MLTLKLSLRPSTITRRVLLAGSLLLASLSSATLTGCKPATSTTPPAALAPGAVNQFDQDSYATLMAAQASLNSLKQSVAQDPANLASLKPILNQAISDYNIAEAAWQVYHAAAQAGSATTAQQTAVTTSLTAVQSDLKKAGQ